MAAAEVEGRCEGGGTEDEEEDGDGEEDEGGGGGEGVKADELVDGMAEVDSDKNVGFTMGAESENEIIDEFAFSIQHANKIPLQLQQDLETEMVLMQGGEGGAGSGGRGSGAGGAAMWPSGPPPPGHWAGQPSGPGSGWSRAGSVTGSGCGIYSGRWSGAGNYDQDFPWDDGDTISDLIGIRRVDSKDVVYENKKKTTKILGHYVMGEVLGEGSYAKVKEAIDAETLCRRAVKIMKKRKLRKIPNGEQNVEREIKLLQVLNHRNVMKLIEVLYNDEKGKIYMVLEYCCAVLQDMLEQSPEKKFPSWQAHDYFTQLLNGLEYLHSKGIIHKDIKPGNLLLDRAGVLKIADFGVCEQLNLYSESDLIVTSQGTPAFQPPEVASGADYFSGEKLDVWSSGVTLFNLTTGDYPFQGDTVFRLFENIGKGTFSFPVPVDRVLEDYIRLLLSLDPCDRPTVKLAKTHDWCRKKFPKNSMAVCAPPQGGDPLLSTTVLPYLEGLHYPSSQPSLITEHDLNRLQAQEAADAAEAGSEAIGQYRHSRLGGARKKSKTTSCLHLKNGCRHQ